MSPCVREEIHDLVSEYLPDRHEHRGSHGHHLNGRPIGRSRSPRFGRIRRPGRYPRATLVTRPARARQQRRFQRGSGPLPRAPLGSGAGQCALDGVRRPGRRAHSRALAPRCSIYRMEVESMRTVSLTTANEEFSRPIGPPFGDRLHDDEPNCSMAADTQADCLNTNWNSRLDHAEPGCEARRAFRNELRPHNLTTRNVGDSLVSRVFIHGTDQNPAIHLYSSVGRISPSGTGHPALQIDEPDRRWRE